MPITPFHLGPGLLIKAAVPRHFSFSAFTAVQVIIDTEVIINMARGHHPFHEFVHTWIGSLLIGACCAALLLIVAPRARNYVFSKHFDQHLRSLLSQDFAPFAIVNGAFIGALSHIVLDGFLHAELNKPWFNVIDIGALHWYFTLAGLVGLLWFVTGWIWRSKLSK